MRNGHLEWLRILKVLRSLSFFPISVSHTMLMTLVSLVVSFLFHMQVSAIDAFSVSLLFGLKLLLLWVDDLGPFFLYYFSPFFSFFLLFLFLFYIFILQIEPIPSGNLPPGFDPSTCRSV